MSTTTSNLGLTKPDGSESYNIDDFNNNAEKIDKLTCIGTAIGQSPGDLSETLYNCTGTLAGHLRYHIAGDVVIIEGRMTINNFVRTGGNPGFTFDLPSGKKAKYSQQLANVGFHGNSSDGVSAGECTRFYATANSGNVKIDVTESYDNFPNATKAYFLINPIIIQTV